MKKCLTIFFLLSVLLFSFNTVTAVAPVTTVFYGETGINVEVQLMPAYQFGEERFSIIHLFNASTGYQITNATNDNITCNLHLRDSQGFEIVIVNATPHLDYWDLNGTGGGTNAIGRYAWTLVCNDNTNLVGGYRSGYFDITDNGKVEPEGLIILGFSIMLLLLLSYSVVIIVKALGHIIDKDFDLMDVAVMWGSYFALLGLGQLAGIYLGNVIINDWLDLFIKLYAFPMVIVPVIALFLSVFNMNRQAKEKAKQW